MKKQHQILVGIIIIILIIIGLIWYFLGPGGEVPITAPTKVHFGNPGTCIGSGMCNCISDDGTAPFGADTNVVHVKFSVLASEPTKLIMSFKLSDYQSHVPLERRNDFVDGGSYTFPTAFRLRDPDNPTISALFNNMPLPPDACILPTSESHVTIKPGNNGDMIVVNTITLSNEPANIATPRIIFNTPPAGTAPDAPHAGGIAFVNPPAHASIAADASIPIPVTFMLKPGDPNVLLMSFSKNGLVAARQDISLFQNNANYTFANTFYFTSPENNPAFSRLPLQQMGENPRISPTSQGSVKISNGGDGDVVTVEIIYDKGPETPAPVLTPTP